MSTDNADAPPLVELNRIGDSVDGDELANPFVRMAASAIDLVWAAIPVFTLFLIWGFVTRAADVPKWLLFAAPGLGFLSFVAVHGYLLRASGQTVGKKLTGIRIVGPNGEVPALANVIFLRYFPVWLVSLFPSFVGSFLVLIDVLFMFRSDRRCMHDLFAGTRVVKVRRLDEVLGEGSAGIPPE
jgi:uncharacterized RDD family membrane protein YckC